MVLVTLEGAGTNIVLGVAVVVGILYGAYRVLSIGRRGRGLPPGMADLLGLRWRWKCVGEADVRDVDWILCEFRAADGADFGHIRFRRLMVISCEFLPRPFLGFRTSGMLKFATSD